MYQKKLERFYYQTEAYAGEYDIPKWEKNHNQSVLNFKKKTNYKMVYSKKNQRINNELFLLYGKYDKNFAVGKYFHQMNINVDDIRRSSTLILDK